MLSHDVLLLVHFVLFVFFFTMRSLFPSIKSVFRMFIIYIVHIKKKRISIIPSLNVSL